MKAVLFPSVVALVAGQPAYFNPVPPKYQPGPCNDPRLRRNHAPNTIASAQCCLTAIPQQPPFPPPGYLPPFETSPCRFMPYAPPMQPPTWAFLDAVCCTEGTSCCDKDTSVRDFKHFLCCDDETQICTHAEDGKGTCEENVDGTAVPQNFAEQVDVYGRCPDGGLAAINGPGQVIECSSNNDIYPDNGDNKCPSNHQCVKDNNPNRNTGVCCFNSGCERNSDCQTCVRRDQHEEDYQNNPCSWLTQGDEVTAGGRCVRSCNTFGDHSCILPERDADCPNNAQWHNGTNYNTGTCERRCGMTGTGRSSRINNYMEALVGPSADATECCLDLSGDYCCAFDLTLAVHCRAGRVAHGPICGTPISGTPNNFFNTFPGTIPPSMGALQANVYRPPPPMFGYPMGPGFGYPMGPGFGYPSMGYPMPGLYAPGFYREYGDAGSDEDAMKAALADQDRQYFYAPGRPMYGPPGFGPGFYGPPPPPPPPPARVDQQPTPYVCSCDADCESLDYADCCKDYWDYCNSENLPDWAIALGWNSTAVDEE